jgi:thiol-disulfide isomerase/thioredoxin
MKFRNIFLVIAVAYSALIFSACEPQNAKEDGNRALAAVGDGNMSNTGNPNAPQKSDTSKLQPAPEAILNTEIKALDGPTFKVADFNGKVVVLNLWATWCGPCRLEMPELIKLQEEFGEQGLVVIGLDSDPEPEQMVRDFVKKMKLNYKIGWSDDTLNGEFLKITKREAIPMSFIISRDGKLAGVFTGFNPQTTPPKFRRVIEEQIAIQW